LWSWSPITLEFTGVIRVYYQLDDVIG